MSIIDSAGSKVSEYEISATLISLRERFEAVRRGEIQRVRGRECRQTVSLSCRDGAQNLQSPRVKNLRGSDNFSEKRLGCTANRI
jgi:hypothetical protein